MTLTDALQYLETTSRVSCPQITCDHAREIAELMREQQRHVDGFRKATAERYAEA